MSKSSSSREALRLYKNLVKTAKASMPSVKGGDRILVDRIRTQFNENKDVSSEDEVHRLILNGYQEIAEFEAASKVYESPALRNVRTAKVIPSLGRIVSTRAPYGTPLQVHQQTQQQSLFSSTTSKKTDIQSTSSSASSNGISINDNSMDEESTTSNVKNIIQRRRSQRKVAHASPNKRSRSDFINPPREIINREDVSMSSFDLFQNDGPQSPTKVARTTMMITSPGQSQQHLSRANSTSTHTDNSGNIIIPAASSLDHVPDLGTAKTPVFVSKSVQGIRSRLSKASNKVTPKNNKGKNNSSASSSTTPSSSSSSSSSSNDSLGSKLTPKFLKKSQRFKKSQQQSPRKTNKIHVASMNDPKSPIQTVTCPKCTNDFIVASPAEPTFFG